jgi:hypothetical protein
MSTDEGACDALLRDPLPLGFSRRVYRVAPGRSFAPARLSDAILLVEQGELQIECSAGTGRRFGRGSMIVIAGLPVARLRSAGLRPLILVAVSRARLDATDEFSRCVGSHDDG